MYRSCRVVLVVVAALLAPRFGRIPAASHRWDRASSPLVYGLVDQVAANNYR